MVAKRVGRFFFTLLLPLYPWDLIHLNTRVRQATQATLHKGLSVWTW